MLGCLFKSSLFLEVGIYAYDLPSHDCFCCIYKLWYITFPFLFISRHILIPVPPFYFYNAKMILIYWIRSPEYIDPIMAWNSNYLGSWVYREPKQTMQIPNSTHAAHYPALNQKGNR